MFENAKPISAAASARFLEKSGIGGGFIAGRAGAGRAGAALDGALIGSIDAAPDETATGTGALRMLEWSELSARLAAARDLRLLLRRDASRHITGDSSFADAAAHYFGKRNDSGGHHKPRVNRVALEASKGSRGIVPIQEDTNGQIQNEEATAAGYSATGSATDAEIDPTLDPTFGPELGSMSDDARDN